MGEKGFTVSLHNGTAGNDTGIAAGFRKPGNALELLKKKCDGTYSDEMRLESREDLHILLVRSALQRGFHNPDLKLGIYATSIGCQAHESDGRNMNLERDAAANPLRHIIGFNQQYPEVFAIFSKTPKHPIPFQIMIPTPRDFDPNRYASRAGGE
jgi:hypothetical protein